MHNVCTRSATLDLTAPVAASRRLDVALTDDAMLSTVLIAFTTAQARDITLSIVDAVSTEEVILSTATGNTAMSYVYQPTARLPLTKQFTFRVQFSQAGGACSVQVLVLTVDE